MSLDAQAWSIHPQGSAPPVRLVLFVGAAAWPDAALAPQLTRHGVRQRCVADLAAARHAGAALRFDACVMDQRLAQRTPPAELERTMASLRCPLLLMPVLERPLPPAPGATLHWQCVPRHRLLPGLLALAPPLPLARPEAAANDAPPAAGAAHAPAGWRYDPARRLLCNGQVVIGLTPVLGGIVQLLLERPGQLVSAAQLQRRMREFGYRSTPGGLRTSVSRLRQALLSQPRAGLTVTAQRRGGYRLCPTPLTRA